MSERRNVFVSYHHGQPGTDGDVEYRDRLERVFEANGDTLLWGAVPDDVIDQRLPEDEIRRQIRDHHLRNTSVTIVLIGARTWQRRHVDWEIGSSLCHTEFSPRSGLFGLLLPTHPDYPGKPSYSQYRIPPRLYDNLACGYAKFYEWTENPEYIAHMIDEAYNRKSAIQPDNTRTPFVNNRDGDRWFD
jgi:plasmid stabilization system protein ParE